MQRTCESLVVVSSGVSVAVLEEEAGGREADGRVGVGAGREFVGGRVEL